jgi:hypothetical protein
MNWRLIQVKIKTVSSIPIMCFCYKPKRIKIVNDKAQQRVDILRLKWKNFQCFKQLPTRVPVSRTIEKQMISHLPTTGKEFMYNNIWTDKSVASAVAMHLKFEISK